MREACGSCIWFKAEPETPINPNVPVVKEYKIKLPIGQKIALDGGSMPRQIILDINYLK